MTIVSAPVLTVIDQVRESILDAMSALDAQIAELTLQRERLAQALPYVDPAPAMTGSEGESVTLVHSNGNGSHNGTSNGHGPVTAEARVDPSAVTVKEFIRAVLNENAGHTMTAQEVHARMLELGWTSRGEHASQLGTIRTTLSQMVRDERDPARRPSEGNYLMPMKKG